MMNVCSHEDRTHGPAPPVLTAKAMQRADQFTIEEYGIPGFTLMESAGRGCADYIESVYGPLDQVPVLILCGKGNNGGDGLVVARRLFAAGARVHVLFTSSSEELREDPARNLDLLRQLQDESEGARLTVSSIENVDTLSETADSLQPRVYVDALLGTGLTSELRPPIDRIVEWLNARSAPTVAIDVPTGLHSDTGEILGAAVRAAHTVTMAATKVGLLVGDGPSCAGSVAVVDIGIPAFVLDRAAEDPGCVRSTTDGAVRTWWPSRAPDAYKYSVGTAIVVGGSRRFSGAPALAAKAATRSGAGYVSCACPETVQPVLANTQPTVPTLSLSTTGEDGISPDAVEDLLDERAEALLVGPGLGRAPDTQRFLHRLFRMMDRPLVLDADGLNALSTLDDWPQYADETWVLTPHEGEFRRLAESVDLSDRVRVVQKYAQRWNVVLLLKGAPSIVAGPDGTTYVGSTGTRALATAGTGDVLAGQCVGLLCQGLDPVHAAAAALHLGGAAAQRYADTRDVRTMSPVDLLDELPYATRERLGRTE